MITLLAVISWQTARGREEVEDEHGQRDKDVVRQAGGLGGDCPACRVFGLSTEQHKKSTVLFLLNIFHT